MKQNKKTKIVVSIVCGLLLLIGAFWLGRISIENKSSETKNNYQPPQRPELPDNPEPSPSNKKEERVLVNTDIENDESFLIFSNWPNARKKSEIKVFQISKKHPQIKKLRSQGKLQKDKWFTIRYRKVDKKTDEGITHHFNEFNQELEIIEV